MNSVNLREFWSFLQRNGAKLFAVGTSASLVSQHLNIYKFLITFECHKSLWGNISVMGETMVYAFHGGPSCEYLRLHCAKRGHLKNRHCYQEGLHIICIIRKPLWGNYFFKNPLFLLHQISCLGVFSVYFKHTQFIWWSPKRSQSFLLYQESLFSFTPN